MLRQELMWALVVLIVIWLYKSFIPPPPEICGTPGGPPITGPRILLRDGRHLSYQEYGVPKTIAKFKIMFIHGHNNNKKDPFLIAPDLFEEFQIYIVSFDRSGYGESDPDPNRTVRSMALDMEELGDELKLGTKFYVMGYSTGGTLGWGCLKYIPHRFV
ncbi:hydrolase [Lithospermum erythrorhizon]|uniref:Hydrolase n=1 Tax=Lithospermum erythrorhizon TaxID=34254 RepID=A0AAV3PC03_LITER